MNFLEALKSGKSFKRESWGYDAPFVKLYEVLSSKYDGKIYVYLSNTHYGSQGEIVHEEYCHLTILDILAEDWIVKEELLPCPLCGCSVELGEEEPSHEEGGFPTPGKVWIKCSNSKCIIEIEELLKFTKKEEFIEKWNNRVGKVRND